MTSGATAASTDGAVLLCDADRFEAGYIKMALIARGLEVLGPLADAHSAFEAIGEADLRAAVITSEQSQDGLRRLLDLLSGKGVPCLVLSDGAAASTLMGVPVLVKPFAAHQIVDWVLQNLKRAL